jgi:exonuclease-1
MLVLCNVCGVKPIIVFDGASLPAKAKEESERRERRAENTKRAKDEIEKRKLSSFGQVDSKLRSMIVQSVSISPEMITRTMSVLRRLNVDFVVAPYEADAQLAFMYRQGLITGVVSEDSDLIAFGCHRLLSKMDMNGDFVDVKLDWAFKGPDLPNKPHDVGELGKLERWTESMFVDLCILSGSDYKLGKIAGIGIKKAFQLLNRLRNLPRIVEEISRSKGWTKEAKETFLEEFNRAKVAFQRHRVFDIKTIQCVTVTDNTVDAHLDEDDHRFDEIIGPEIDSERAKQIMAGEIEAKTGEKRFFLDRLPPGVLGVYNASLRPKEATPVDLTADENIRDRGQQYEELEQQVVAEFEKYKGNILRPEAIEINRRSYLNKLEALILSSGTPSTAPTSSFEEEFGDIEALLQLDEDLEAKFDDQGIIDLEEDSAEPTQPVVDSSLVIDPLVRQSKVKNPFARRVDEENKKPRQSIVGQTSVAAVLPHLQAKARLSLPGEVKTISDLFDQNRRLSLESKGKTEKLVSTRDVPVQAPKPFFVRR